jgi:predicted O-methyltransferase YrrM
VDILSVEIDDTLGATARGDDWPSYVRIETANVETALADHPGAFDLILADASTLTCDQVDAMVDASRSGGMLIFNRSAFRAAAASEPEDVPLSALRQTVLDHDKLVVVDTDWSDGLLIAAKRS